MAGPNLELFKFSLYLFFPLAVMVHYGDPQWYHDNVLPFRDRFWPDPDTLYKPPRNAEDLRSAMKDLREQRLGSAKMRSQDRAVGAAPSAAVPSLRPNGSLGRVQQASPVLGIPAALKGTFPKTAGPSLRPIGSLGSLSSYEAPGRRTATLSRQQNTKT